ncbi:MAG: hypothetical protein ACRCWY_04375 [Cellulosilyticaceae bacterium]
MAECKEKFVGEETKGGCCEKSCGLICGNNIDLEVSHCDCEIHADVMVKQLEPSIRVWGQIKDCYDNPVKGCLLKLLRVVEKCGKTEYYGVAHTMSDCEGFYQFDLARPCYGASYKILVGKVATGEEREIVSGETCKCCNEKPCIKK